MQDITILDTSIRQDAEGRYSLSDLHKAAMAAAERVRTHSHQPISSALKISRDVIEAMYSDVSTDSDALVYTGSIVSSMLHSANSLISSPSSPRGSREDIKAISSAAITCFEVQLLLDGRGFCLSSALAKNASDALHNLEVAYFFSSGMSREDDGPKRSVKTYIIKSQASGLIKIGRSSDPDRRIRSLSTASGSELDVLAIIDADIESALHRKFADIRVHGEWFSDDGRISSLAEEKALLEDITQLRLLLGG